MLIAFSATNPRKGEAESESPFFENVVYLMFQAICPTTLQHFSKLFFGARETFDDVGGVYDNMDYLPKLLELRLDGTRE